jgi:hypothetical protein
MGHGLHASLSHYEIIDVVPVLVEAISFPTQRQYELARFSDYPEVVPAHDGQGIDQIPRQVDIIHIASTSTSAFSSGRSFGGYKFSLSLAHASHCRHVASATSPVGCMVRGIGARRSEPSQMLSSVDGAEHGCMPHTYFSESFHGVAPIKLSDPGT